MDKLGVGLVSASAVAVYSRTAEKAKELASFAEQLGLSRPKVYTDVWDLLRDSKVNAIWILTPNDTHVTFAKYVAEEARQGRGNLVGVVVEKPG